MFFLMGWAVNLLACELSFSLSFFVYLNVYSSQSYNDYMRDYHHNVGPPAPWQTLVCLRSYWSFYLLIALLFDHVIGQCKMMWRLSHQATYPSVEQPPPHHPPYYHHSHPPPPPHQAYHHHHHPQMPPHEAPPPRFRDKQRAPQHRAFTSSPVSSIYLPSGQMGHELSSRIQGR